MRDTAIQVENLGKMYRIGAAEQAPRTWRQRAGRTLKAPFDYLLRMRRPPTEDETLWALRDISFEVKHGEVMGIIGANGAGKSTLLKILTRITEPTSGRAEMYGRVGSLLEVGTGFHPELTGRENIYLSGAIMGMKKLEIDSKFDEVVDFSGVGKFIDTPVKRYSSGMRVRLGFAVAAHMEPEILLIDEVLAVGDAQFQKKCLGKMDNVAKEGRTVLFVSHNMGAISRLCEKTLWIDEGRIRMNDATEAVVSQYLTSDLTHSGQRKWEGGIADAGITEFALNAIRIRSMDGEITHLLDARKSFWVEIEYEILKQLPFCRVGFRISTVDGVTVFATYDADHDEYAGPRDPGRFVSRCEIPGYLLNPGRFVLSSAAGITGVKTLMQVDNVLSLDIAETGSVGSQITGKRSGVIRPKLEWCREAILE